MDKQLNDDPAAVTASESPNASPGRDVGKKNKKLVIFLILLLIFLIPLAGIAVLIYTNNTTYIPYYPF